MYTQMETFPPLKRSSVVQEVQCVYDDQTIQVVPVLVLCQSHLRAPGEGLSRVNSVSYCDHYVHVKRQIPSPNKHKVMMEVYAELEEDTPGQIMGVSSSIVPW
ncbi:protein tumorous imaginal discs, mitochondrial-like [Armigeres subalbatus]|uniref:protein tumorous imaginal discs, mitochondrial-like n=1 Tax=Armigeres subalbatus TaxID=124917 RepID=UPI002ED43309